MPIHYEYSNADQLQPVETGACTSSASLASGATTGTAFASDGYVTITATEDGYVAIGPSPNSGVDPRRRVLNGVARSFSVEAGDKLMFTAG